MPVRIQRKRTKGWKMPDNTISVTRPGEFGNPFKVGGWFKIGKNHGGVGFAWTQAYEGYQNADFTLIKDNQMAIDMYRQYLKEWPLNPEKINKLRGKNLACFCALDQPCHADVLLEVANQ